MASEHSELDDLFREDHPDGSHESRQSGRRTTGGSHERSYRTQHGGVTVSLRIKPDRRRLITRVEPVNERRRS
jgi:hypothetical protein